MRDVTREQVRAFIAARLQISPAELIDSDPLFSTGRADSLAAIDLILFLERELALDAGDPDFDPSMLDSVDEIMRLV